MQSTANQQIVMIDCYINIYKSDNNVIIIEYFNVNTWAGNINSITTMMIIIDVNYYYYDVIIITVDVIITIVIMI